MSRTVLPLSDAITLQRGFDLPTPQRRSGKYPVVASTGTTTTHHKAKVKGPGVVIGRSGSIGGGQYIEKDFWPLNTTLWVKDFKGNNELFIYYLLKSIDFSSFNAGGAVPTLNRNHLSMLKVSIPSRDEQDDIANILGTIDEKIELNRKMNETLEQIGQALFRHYFIVNPESKTWPIGKLKDLFDVVMGQSPPGSSYNEQGDGIVFYQGRAEFGIRFPNQRLSTTEPKRRAKRGDVLLSVRAPVGDINQATENCCVGRGLAAISHKQSLVSYGYYFMKSLQTELGEYNAEGTVFGAINGNTLKSLSVKTPPSDLQEKFNGLAASLDNQVWKNSEELNNLASLRDLLLPRLISGKIKV